MRREKAKLADIIVRARSRASPGKDAVRESLYVPRYLPMRRVAEKGGSSLALIVVTRVGIVFIVVIGSVFRECGILTKMKRSETELLLRRGCFVS